MLEIDKVIVLENKEEYLILDKIEINNKYYYYIAKINETKTDIDNNFKLITIEERENNQVINEVTGEDKLKEILPLFSKSYRINA